LVPAPRAAVHRWLARGVAAVSPHVVYDIHIWRKPAIPGESPASRH
jgi:hypothetical protein